MGKIYSALEAGVVEFIEQQRLFFVATAPREGGHVNLSPKGYDTFRVLSPNEVAYLDLTGSGAETIAHLRENGRIVIMFCAFEGAPKILRLWGRGVAVEPGEVGYDEIIGRFPQHRGARAIVRVAIERVADSCGYAVPLYTFAGDRDQLHAWTDRKDDDALVEYRARKNAASIDGLAALSSAIRSAK